MSTPLALGAVSAVLRNLLDDGLVAVSPALGSVRVTALAPDRIDLDDENAPPSLNVFLYRVTPNQGRWNDALPWYSTNGQRQSSPPLALDLHYLVTAYGREDFEAEILLGYAMHVLYQRPVLDRDSIRTALGAGVLGTAILPPAYQALSGADLADQLEAVTVTLEPMDTEEISKLWAATQARYRPTAAYQVTTVLIDVPRPVRSALPVLSRGPVDPATERDRGVVVEPSLLPPLPTLTAAVVSGAEDRSAALLGDTVELRGHHLDGTGVAAVLSHRLLDSPHRIALPDNDDGSRLTVAVPSGGAAEAGWPAGVWTVAVELTPPGDPVARTSNAVALLLAPEPVLAPAPTMVRDATTGVLTVTLALRPQVRPSQAARLALGGEQAPKEPHPAAASSLTFAFGPVPDGAQWVRLTVDGVESLLVDRSGAHPAFDPSQQVVVPV